MIILTSVLGGYMARINRDTPAKRLDRAFELYMELDDLFKPVYTVAQVAEFSKVSVDTIRFHVNRKSKEKWADLRKEAVERARATGSHHDVARLARNRTKRAKHVEQVVTNLGDIIYEVRAYNHLMFKQLMARALPGEKADPDEIEDSINKLERKHKGKRKAPPLLHIPIVNRAEVHRAWLDSLDRLFTLFGVGTIKELAAEMITSTAVNAVLAQATPQVGGPTVGISIVNNNGANPVGGVATDINASTVNIDDRSYEHILVMMAEKGKISGPVNYTGPNATSIVEGVEDAIITREGGLDQ